MKPTRKYQPFIVAGAAILVIYGAVLFWSHFTGTLALTENAKITELGACIQEHLYQPVATVIQGTKNIYACGKVEGTTSMFVALYLFNDNLDRADFVEAARLWPGTFFVPLSPSMDLEPGPYHIQAGKNQLIVAEAHFTVVRVPSTAMLTRAAIPGTTLHNHVSASSLSRLFFSCIASRIASRTSATNSSSCGSNVAIGASYLMSFHQNPLSSLALVLFT